MDEDNFLGCGCIAVVIIASIAWAFFSAAIEANSFNACTGSNATVIDALVTELRVENCKR